MQLRRLSSTKCTRVFEGEMKFVYHQATQDNPLSNSICEVIYNNPQKMNPIGQQVQMQLLKHVKMWKDDPTTVPKFLLMHGQGKAFTAGGDIKFLTTTKNYNDYDSFMRAWHLSLLYFGKETKSFQITLWNGYCAGGGLGLSIFAPIRIATEYSQVTMPESLIGFFTNAAASYFLSRQVKDKEFGMFLGMTGAKVVGADLQRSGIATHYMPHSNIEKFRKVLIGSLNDRLTVGEVREIVDLYSINDYKDEQIGNIEQIKDLYQYDSYQNIHRRLNASNTAFARNLRHNLEKENACPLSQAMVFELIKKYSAIDDIKQAIYNDYRMESSFFGKEGDFKEGVRAKLIDKDNNPKWKHKSLLDVSQDEIREHIEFPVKETLEEVYDMKKFPYWNTILKS